MHTYVAFILILAYPEQNIVILLVWCDQAFMTKNQWVLSLWQLWPYLSCIVYVSVATLKLDISPPYASLPCCLTSNLWQVEPYTDMNRRPTREIEEFPSRPVYSPNIVYK